MLLFAYLLNNTNENTNNNTVTENNTFGNGGFGMGGNTVECTEITYNLIEDNGKFI